MRCRLSGRHLRERRSRAPSSDRAFRLALADAYLGSSHAKRNLGDDRGAFESATECLRLYRDAADADRSNRVVLRGLAGAPQRSAWRNRVSGNSNRRSRVFARVRPRSRRLVAAEPRNVNLEPRADAGVRTCRRRARESRPAEPRRSIGRARRRIGRLRTSENGCMKRTARISVRPPTTASS